MQSNGGLAPVESAIEKPMYCIESGPAAGVVGAYHLGKRLGIENVMTFDMGGTTAKASIIEDGEMLLAPEYEVGGGMSAGHRLLKGGQVRSKEACWHWRDYRAGNRIPAIRVHRVGACYTSALHAARRSNPRKVQGRVHAW